jgi:hypothetical protein
MQRDAAEPLISLEAMRRKGASGYTIVFLRVAHDDQGAAPVAETSKEHEAKLPFNRSVARDIPTAASTSSCPSRTLNRSSSVLVSTQLTRDAR